LPQRIAIISVETSKGYVDFLKVIESNSWNYKFFHFLFPSLLQGDKAVPSILAQLKRIKKVKEHFDVVAIIRGGGGDVGLSCYNNYLLAKEIALFPIPVITGIGHATNETVSEMISFSNAITPTKLAEYLLQKFHNFSVPVQDAEKKIIDKSKRLLIEEQVKFQSELKLFRSVTENILITNNNEIRGLSKSLQQHAQFIFKNENEFLKTSRNNIVKATNAISLKTKEDLKNIAIGIRKDSASQLNQFKFRISQLKGNLQLQSVLKFKTSLLELSNIEKKHIEYESFKCFKTRL
jgi:exodeoxyribonuclease VII large subunit